MTPLKTGKNDAAGKMAQRLERIGARSRTRTGTLLPARDFKSLVSTDFTIRAGGTEVGR